MLKIAFDVFFHGFFSSLSVLSFISILCGCFVFLVDFFYGVFLLVCCLFFVIRLIIKENLTLFSSELSEEEEKIEKTN